MKPILFFFTLCGFLGFFSSFSFVKKEKYSVGKRQVEVWDTQTVVALIQKGKHYVNAKADVLNNNYMIAKETIMLKPTHHEGAIFEETQRAISVKAEEFKWEGIPAKYAIVRDSFLTKTDCEGRKTYTYFEINRMIEIPTVRKIVISPAEYKPQTFYSLLKDGDGEKIIPMETCVETGRVVKGCYDPDYVSLPDEYKTFKILTCRKQ
jgi:hypothetical protein